METPIKKIVWEIIPQNTPLVSRNCSKCEKKMDFYCSELFRLNAQQHYVDIWLIYKCSHCDSTWNETIFSRINPQKINHDLYEKFTCNDKETAWKYAFDIQTLRKNNAVVVYNIDYEIKGEDIDIFNRKDDKIQIYLNSPYIFNLRLDKVLRERLGVSRKELSDLELQGVIRVEPQVDIERYKIKENLNIFLDLDKMNLNRITN